MLAKTKEFGNFANVAIASGENGVRYMQSERVSTPASPPKEETNSDDNDEADSWITETAYKVAHDFILKSLSLYLINPSPITERESFLSEAKL